MLLSTPGLVLHVTPYGESSVVVKVFTRLLGLRSYVIKGVRGNRGRVKQNLLQPLSSLDMVVYDNPKTDLNYVKELSPRHPDTDADPVVNALRFFMTEVLYKSLPLAEPMPALWDYVDGVLAPPYSDLPLGSDADSEASTADPHHSHAPILFLLTVAFHLGIQPLDNLSPRTPYFDLQQGRYVSSPSETTLTVAHSDMLHVYLANRRSLLPPFPLGERIHLIDALIAYFQLHLSGFSHFRSHEILHSILK